jgi:hypothetical protein
VVKVVWGCDAFGASAVAHQEENKNKKNKGCERSLWSRMSEAAMRSALYLLQKAC